MELISQGAEAQIFRKDEQTLTKIRNPKTYRLDILDKEIRNFRTKREFKILQTLSAKNVNVPKPFKIYEKEYMFDFEYLNGIMLKTILNENLLFKAFDEIIKMHNLNIIHYDLTTLNMINKDNKVYIIDFGLGVFSTKSENKAEDLNLFFNCIKNEHAPFYHLKPQLEQVYIKNAIDGNNTIIKLRNIEKRGRNKNKQ